MSRRVGVGDRDKPGHDVGGNGDRATTLNRHGRARPGHPRRRFDTILPSKADDPPGSRNNRRAGRGGSAWVTGTSPVMTSGGRRRSSHDPQSSWPGLSRPPTPKVRHHPTEQSRRPPGIAEQQASGSRRVGVGDRDKPGHDVGGATAIEPTTLSRHGRACPGHPRRSIGTILPSKAGDPRDCGTTGERVAAGRRG